MAAENSRRTKKPESLLPPFGLAYFDHVMAEYDLLSATLETAGPGARPAVPPRIEKVQEKYHNDPNHLSWGDLYELEKYVLGKQPDEVVKCRAAGLRENYRQIIGQRAYESYLQSHPPEPRGCDSIEAIRADLGRLLDALHWAYLMIPEREQRRTKIIEHVGIAVTIFSVSAFVAILALYHYHQPLLATVVAVLSMGGVGGFVSLLQRIQKISTEGDPIITIFELQSGDFVLYLAPLTGAIFALVLFLMFLGDVVSGTVFPAIADKLIQGPDPISDLANYGKLLVWSFIAGFAERFVPDTLNRLMVRTERAPVAVVTVVAPSAASAGAAGDHAGGTNGAKQPAAAAEQTHAGREKEEHTRQAA